MDSQNQSPYAPQDQIATGIPNQTGYIYPVHTNPYTAIQQQDVLATPTPQQQQGPQLPSMSDFIIKQAQADKINPAELTNDQIRAYGKKYIAYDKNDLTDLDKNGPLVHALGGNYKGTRENFELHHAAHARAAMDQLEQNMDAFKQHLQSLSGTQAAPQQPQDIGPLQSVSNALQTGIKQTIGLGAEALGGLPYAVNRLANPLAPPEAVQRDIDENGLTSKWQDFFHGIAQKESGDDYLNTLKKHLKDVAPKDIPAAILAAQKENAANALAGPGNSLLSKAAYTAASLPTAILTGGMGNALDEARTSINKGVDIDDVKKNLAIDAAQNVAQAFLPGGKLVARAAKGALYAPLLQNATAVLKGEATPDMQDNLLSAIFGAGFSAALGRRPGGNVAPKPGEAPPTGSSTTDADALAAQATSQVPFALSPEHKAAAEQIAKAVKSVEPEAIQEHYDTIASGMTPQEANAFGNQINAEAVRLHGKDAPQIEVQPLGETNAASAQAEPVQPGGTENQTAAPENTIQTGGATNERIVNPEHQQIVNDALTQVAGAEVGTKKGQIGSGKLVPITFKNELDKLAYVYSKTKDENARAALGVELQKRGVPADALTSYADAVSSYIKSTANALKHHVIADDIAAKQDWAPKEPATKPVPLPKDMLKGKRGPKA